MTPPRDLHDKDAMMAALMARIEALVARNESLVAENAALAARVAELEVKLGLPPKTPDNSSVPPSKGQKPSGAPQPPRRRPSRIGVRIVRCTPPQPRSARCWRRPARVVAPTCPA